MTDERTYLYNGQFRNNLDQWDAVDATYAASDGDAQYGMAVLAVGGSVAQDFAVEYVRAYTLAVKLKCAGAVTAGMVTVTLEDGDGNTVATLQPLAPTANQWAATEFTLGLVSGTTYSLTITNVSAPASVKVDDVWLWPVPMTRAQLAAAIAAKLGRLATERGLSTTPSGVNTEGDYTSAIDRGLRNVEALDDESGLPDVRWLDDDTLDAAMDAIEEEMIERLRRDYAVETDISVQGRSESRSQIGAALEQMRSAGGNKRVVMKTLRHGSEE